jgi:hypothetical protein
MVGWAAICLALGSAVLVAAAVRSSSLVTAILAAYLALVTNVGAVTWALSPFHDVREVPVTLAEAAIFAGALGAWWLRGRPGLPLAPARTVAPAAARDPVTACILGALIVLLAYELVLALAAPQNNGDVLAFHLTRAAAWAQHGGVYWVPNTPTISINVLQPLAEQQLLFLFVTTGGGGLSAMPQLVAELAILVAVYGAARRLGFEVRAATGAMFLVAAFSTVALESTTALSDLVAASFPVVAACCLLGTGRLDPVLAGIAVALGIGAKLDIALDAPALALLALVRGRRAIAWAGAGLLGGMVAVGMWSFVLNAISTGHILGAGSGDPEDRASPSYPGSVANAFNLMYGTLDLSVLSNRLVFWLAALGVLAAVAAAAYALRRTGLRGAPAAAASVGTPLLAPLIVFGASGVVAWGAARWGFPIRGPNGFTHYVDGELNETWTRLSNENFSAFGPVGIVALLAASLATLYRYVVRRVDARHLALAVAYPCGFALMALVTVWSVYTVHFLIMPAVVAAPLLAVLVRQRAAAAVWCGVAALVVALTVAHDQAKPLQSPYGLGPPWQLSQWSSLVTNSRTDNADSLLAYERLVPPHACVGAVVEGNEPSYLLYGPRLNHRVYFLSVYDALDEALRQGLFYVVITTGSDRWAADGFRHAGWSIRPLGTNWLLASERHAGSGAC